jgi:hypothetical protein
MPDCSKNQQEEIETILNRMEIQTNCKYESMKIRVCDIRICTGAERSDRRAGLREELSKYFSWDFQLRLPLSQYFYKRTDARGGGDGKEEDRQETKMDRRATVVTVFTLAV